jgi:predicted nucleic acid-binding protein
VRPVLVDANVLLRLLTNDPPNMAEQAVALAQRAEKGDVVLRVVPLVVAETVWVLRSFYGFGRREIADVLTSMLTAKGVDADDCDLVLAALESMARASVDFVDAYLAQVSRSHGEAVCSFDEDFRRLEVELMTPG